MSSQSISRRDFVRGTGAVAGSAAFRLPAAALAAAATAATSACTQKAAFRTLSNADAREIEAIAARILPSTETPGAREAGVIYFIDNVLGDAFAGMATPLRASLERFQQDVGERFDGSQRFSDLATDEQDTWLKTQEDGALFSMVYPLTIMGFFAMSQYGGNRDNVGWKLIDFEGHGASAPPFGYYDAEFRKENPDGA